MRRHLEAFWIDAGGITYKRTASSLRSVGANCKEV